MSELHSKGRMSAMSMKPSSIVISIASLLSLGIAGTVPLLNAQAVSNATVTGRVTDEQSAVIPNARIQITAVETGAVYTVSTNSDGIYTFPNLPIGSYALQAAVTGFQTYIRSGIALRVGDNVQLNIAMKVG